ncbi:glycosyltransferase family 2 protein [Sedimentitalea arenosa]|uniref:glycosyltransferase family 2 protein n=1 Tax=Sedimentitalea arenosa TaxID=2798803 RepID=UPI0022A7CC99|nr:glycosyltransferase family 2 protein [Arenibacterium arenosum]
MTGAGSLRWGIVATIKAPTAETLAFAAHHIELGAHRIYVYLDAPDPEAVHHLKSHPKTRVVSCDAAYWRKLGKPRPKKHQVRQVLNATHAYGRAAEVDWLAHIDVDEFLWSQDTIAAALSTLPEGALCARVRPIESLAGDGDAFKGFIPPGPDRARISEAVFPGVGTEVPCGFLSHLAGKLFLRTGLSNLTFRIHNAFQGTEMNPAEHPLPGVDLCHRHVRDWQSWRQAARYRLDHGAYREGLGGGTLHRILRDADATGGEAGLRAVFDALCADTPAMRARLSEAGLLHLRPLDLVAKRARQFPDFEPPTTGDTDDTE